MDSSAARALADAAASLERGDALRAWSISRSLLPVAGHVASVHRIAGLAALALRRPGDALPHLARAFAIAPDVPANAATFALALAKSRRSGEALRIARGITGDPAASDLDALAQAFSLAGAHDEALACSTRAVEREPNEAGLRWNLATALVHHGRTADAAREYEACLRLRPGHARAHLALAQLRQGSAAAAEIDRVRQALAATPAAERRDRMYLHLALARTYESTGEADLAFEHFSAGKRLGREESGPSWPRDEARMRALLDRFPKGTASSSPSRAGEADGPCGAPIFVVGMPRSGTTLVDRILSSHPDVVSAGERLDFAMALRRAAPSGGLLDAAHVRATVNIDPARVGADYLAGLRGILPADRRPVDKLPHNLLSVPFIAEALPLARIVWLDRGPLDACIGNFRELFDPGSPWHGYSFDLLDTGRHRLMTDRLLDRWRDVVGGRLLVLSYEALVARQEVETRRLLAFCGLDWDPRCLAFEKHTGAVATASATQVRQPLHSRAIGRWRNFERHLGPLQDLLQRGLDA